MAVTPSMTPHPSHDHKPGWRSSLLATGACLAAALAMLGVFRLDSAFAWNVLPVVQVIGIAVLASAGLTSAIPVARPLGWLLLWNAIGIELSLLATGFTSVGAIFVVPLALTAFAISCWPRGDEPWIGGHVGAIMVAGGALLVPGSFALYYGVLWLSGLVG